MINRLRLLARPQSQHAAQNLHWTTFYPNYNSESLIDQRRVRWIVLACGVAFFVAIPVAILSWRNFGLAAGLTELTSSWINLLALVVLRSTASIRWAGHTLCLTVAYSLLFQESPPEFRVVALLAIPILSVHLTGPRWGAVWSIAALATVYFYGLAELPPAVDAQSLVFGLLIVGGLITIGSLVLESSLSSTANRSQRSEDQLQQQRQGLRQFIEREFPGFIELTDNRISFVSEGVEHFFGYAGAELLHQRFDQFLHPTDLDTLYQQVRSGVGFRNEVRVRHQNGQWVPIEVICIPDNQFNRWVIAFRDITSEYESRRRMAQAERLRGVGVLAAGVAHDFNNLLTVIMGFTDLLPRSSEKTEIAKAVDKAAELTSRLMVFGGPGSEIYQRIRLADVCADMIPMFKSLMGERVDFRTNLDSNQLSEIEIDANAGQINQILLNVITNAKESMPNGGHCSLHLDTIEIDGQQTPDNGIRPGTYGRIQINDTGLGMSDDTLEQAFDPFFSTKDKARGRGLGLASAYGVMQQHRGYILLESAPNAGTLVTLLFPKAEAESSALVHSVALATPEENFTGTALVVEDEPVIRDIISRILSGAGLNVITAASGSEAVTKFQNLRRTPDLLVTDVVMPGVKGSELARQLIASAPGLKILFISGYSSEELDDFDTSSTDVQFLAKPFRREELLGRVRLLVDNTAKVSNL